MPPLAAAAYAWGDLNCHQREARSLVAHGNQFPVDARMLALFAAANGGFALALGAPDRDRARDALADALPARLRRRLATTRRRRLALVALVAAGLVPAALDAGLQMATPYESGNALRLATGTLLGACMAAWLGLGFDALARPLPPRARAEAARPRPAAP